MNNKKGNNNNDYVSTGFSMLKENLFQPLKETHSCKMEIIMNDSSKSDDEKLAALDENDNKLIHKVFLIIGAVAYFICQISANGNTDIRVQDVIKKITTKAVQ